MVCCVREPHRRCPQGVPPGADGGAERHDAESARPAVIGVLDVARVFRYAARHRHASRDEVASFQDAQLRRLIAHAYANVPYYRRLFERHGVEPGRVRTVADLARVPVTSRRDLQTEPLARLLTRGVDPTRLIVHATSGSTGEPLQVRRTWPEERITSVFRLRAFRDFGLRLRDTRVRFLLPRGADARNWEGPQKLVRALGFHRKVLLDRSLPLAEQVRRLSTLRADAITGTPGTLLRLATALAHERPGAVRPRVVISGGDVLTPAMRRAIAEAFGAPVYDMYGSYEFGIIAWECPRAGGLHVADDGLVLEVLRDGRAAGPGESGEVVATQLHAYAAPFIRYRLGDVVTRGEIPCRCGAPFSTLLDVQGRRQDYLPLANGRLFMSREVTLLSLKHSQSWVGQFQLTQERPDHVVLRIVPLAPPAPGAVAALAQATRERLGPGIGLEILLVPDLPLEADGKFRVARSLVTITPLFSDKAERNHG
jgi:phenylacetate-CoA ligase